MLKQIVFPAIIYFTCRDNKLFDLKNVFIDF